MNKQEIKDIAMWEETDSELAKYNIQSLSSLIRNQVNQLKANDSMIGELINRIDKAIEYLKDNACYENTISELFCDDLDTDSCMELLDILRGKDTPKEEKKIEKLNEHYYHDEPALIDDMAHKINEIINKVNKL